MTTGDKRQFASFCFKLLPNPSRGFDQFNRFRAQLIFFINSPRPVFHNEGAVAENAAAFLLQRNLHRRFASKKFPVVISNIRKFICSKRRKLLSPQHDGQKILSARVRYLNFNPFTPAGAGVEIHSRQKLRRRSFP